ncbi:MAG: hypothetical protein ACPGQS_09745, partial [Bradymonadia bacterium]
QATRLGSITRTRPSDATHRGTWVLFPEPVGAVSTTAPSRRALMMALRADSIGNVTAVINANLPFTEVGEKD